MDLITSGIAPVDERLGGFMPSRLHVLTGAPGTGKTVACLEFLHAAFEDGPATVLLTHDDPTDLLAQGEFLGIDLERALAEERLVLLRYQLDFVRRFTRASTADMAFAELRRLVGDRPISRIAIDSVVPFLEAGPASAPGIEGMQRFLDALGATALVTLPGDLAGRFDRRLEPLFRRAAAVLHLSRDGDQRCRIEIRKVRYQVPSTAPISVHIEAGTGLVGPDTDLRRRLGDVPEETRRKLLVLDLAGTLRGEVLDVLRMRFDVAVRRDAAAASAPLALGSIGGVVMDVRRDNVDMAIGLVRELRQAGARAPMVFVSDFNLRSSDRARALRAGADEFLSSRMHPEELLIRIETVVRAGRAPGPRFVEREIPLLVQPEAGGGYQVMDEDAFRRAVRERVDAERAPFFTVVGLRPRAGELATLAEVAMRTMRAEGGDLAGMLDDRVAVYLHSARRKDIVPFIDRVREEWARRGHGDLEAEPLSYPADESRMRSLLFQTAS